MDKLNQLLQSAIVLGVTPLFTSDPETLRMRRRSAEKRSGREHAFLENYFWINLAPRSQGEKFVDALNALTIVEIAYLPPIPQSPDIPPATPDFEPEQGYLEPARQQGIDARYSWTRPGGRGSGMRVVDVEAGWNHSHEDLPNPFFTLGIGGLNTPGFDFDGDGVPDNSHGTEVLGVLVGRNDGRGVTGIASDAEYAVVSVIRLES
jgi:hypothetical protein